MANDQGRGAAAGPPGWRAFFSTRRWIRAEEACFAAFRVFVGVFLIWGVWDNIISAERMNEFAAFLDFHGFVWPSLLAPLSVWAQFACGVSFVSGFLVRWGGLLCAVNFLVALVMVDAAAGFRAAFPAAMLLFFGTYLAARGPGKLSLDALITRRI